MRFACQRCGKCCTNRGGYAFVYLAEADIVAITGFLGLERAEFLARHCVETDGFVSLKTDSPACEFLREDKSCAIYPVRPKQCATYPFWDENLVRATWEEDIAKNCPGVGVGPLHSREEIERVAREDREWYEVG